MANVNNNTADLFGKWIIFNPNLLCRLMSIRLLLPSAARQHTILDAIRTSPLPELYNAKKISIFNRFGWMLVGLRNNYKRPLRIFKSSTSASNYCHKINIFAILCHCGLLKEDLPYSCFQVSLSMLC